MLNSITKYLILPFVLGIPMTSSPQGSWDPAGADLSFPRTLLDTTQIDTICNTLTNPEIFSIYELVWNNATSTPPAGNITDGDRFSRSVIAKEAAFVALMNRKPSGGSIVPLTTTEREQLTTQSEQLLETMNTAVGFQSGWIFYQEWQHRSKELINYLVAYDLLRGQELAVGSLQSARDSLIEFTAHLFHRAKATYTVFIWQFKFFEFQFNNHSIMTASALGLAAIVLNDHESTDPDYQPQNWIDAGLFNLDNTLWREDGAYKRVSQPDTLAGYAEGPAYFEYAFENAFPFIRACWNFLPDSSYAMIFGGVTRDIRNPWYDPSYANLYEWMNRIRMPDGSCTAIHDSPIGFGTSITALSGNSRFNIPNANYPPTDAMWRTQYIATNVSQGAFSDTLFRSLPEAGSLVFRSSNDPDAVYIHFIGKHGIPLSGAKAHHQGDAGSFSLMANGELLAVDPGYPGYQESYAVNTASNHNLVLVNGFGPLPPVGEMVSIETNTSWIEHGFDTPQLDYGEIRTAYFGADIVRKNLFIRDRYFILADFLSSANTNTYTYQLQGNGLFGGISGTPEGAFVPDFPNQQGTWSRDSTHLLVHTIATGGATNYSYAPDSLATGTSQYRHYSKMLVRKDSVPGTGFLSVLFPYPEAPPDVITLAAGPMVNAIRVTDGNYQDLAFAQQDSGMISIPASVSGLPETVKGNGTLNLVEYNPLYPRLFFLGHGDTLQAGDQHYIVSNYRTVTAYDLVTPEFHRGYVSDSGWVGFYTLAPQVYQPTSGNILEYYPDPVNSLLWIRFASASYFTIELMEGAPELKPISTLNLEVRPAGDAKVRLIITCNQSFRGELKLVSVTGQELHHRKITGNPGQTGYLLDLSPYAHGLYLIYVATTAGSGTVKTIY